MTAKKRAEKVKELRELSRMVEDLTAEIESIKDELKAEMNDGNGYELHGIDYKITWHEVVSKKIDTTALKKELPDIAARYTKESKSRRFLLA